MAGISDANPHREYFPSDDRAAFHVVYWRGNAASGKSQADRAEIVLLGEHWSPIARFKLPAKRAELDTLIRGLLRVREAGRNAKAREVLAVLGVT